MTDRTLAREGPRHARLAEDDPRFLSAFAQAADGASDGAAALLDRLAADRDAAGLRGEVAAIAWLRVQVECLRGDHERARRLATESHVIASESGDDDLRADSALAEAIVEAHLGNDDRARRLAAGALDWYEAHGAALRVGWCRTLLGALSLAAGDPAAAMSAWSDGLADGRVGLTPMPVEADAVEALIALGELEEAERITAEMEARGIEGDAEWTRLAAARSRALVLATRQDLAEAEALLVRTLEINPHAPPLEQGRSLLSLGQIQRRHREHRIAEATLECALTMFTSLRAESWAEATRRELARVGAQPPAPATLTTTEARVAELAASGMTNRAIASMLFLSPKTVEANLHRVYRKLGITSRTELVAPGTELQQPSRA